MIKNKGQALLVSVIIVGFSSVAAALYLISSVSSQALIGSSYSYSQKSLSSAQSGIDDALMKLTRDANYASTGYTLPAISLDGTIKVEVLKDNPASGQTTINSNCEYSKSIKKIQAVVSRDPQGKIDIISYKISE